MSIRVLLSAAAANYLSTILKVDIFGDNSGIALYRFESNVLDDSGTYNGTATSITYASSKFDLGAVFNGTASKIITAMTVPNVFSISLWFKTTVSAYTGRLLNFTTAQGRQALFTDATTSTLCYFYDSSAYKGVAITAVNNGNLHHLVITSDNRLYIDNIEITAALGNTVGATDTTFTVGAWSGGAAQYFNGGLDHIRVFNKNVTTLEVAALFNEF